jgi:Zn-dependent protease
MFNREIKLIKLFGIDIVLDPSWFWIFLLVATSFYLSTSSLNTEVVIRFFLSIFGATLFFASVLLHELSHTFVANKNKLRVSKITLFIFGGVANLRTEPKNPKTELTMALVGPISSAVIGLTFLLLYYLFKFSTPLGWLFMNLGYLNFLLAIFNIIPAYPLDGGRVFRSIVWLKTNNFNKATELASLMGRIFAAFIILWGAIQVLFLGIISGLWLVFIGVFIYRLAAVSPFESLVVKELDSIKVEKILRDYPQYIPGQDLADALERARINLFEYIVVKDSKGVPVGLIEVDHINPNKEITELDKIPEIKSNDNLLDVLQNVEEKKSLVFRVTRGSKFIGILTLSDIAQILQRLRREITKE